MDKLIASGSISNDIELDINKFTVIIGENRFRKRYILNTVEQFKRGLYQEVNARAYDKVRYESSLNDSVKWVEISNKGNISTNFLSAYGEYIGVRMNNPKELFSYNFDEDKKYHIILENPENNLHPSEQYQLINDIVKLYHSIDCTIFMATNSPYVLTTLNNLFFAGRLKDTFNDFNSEIMGHKDLYISPKELSVYEVDKFTNLITDDDGSHDTDIASDAIDTISDTINKVYTKLFCWEQEKYPDDVDYEEESKKSLM